MSKVPKVPSGCRLSGIAETLSSFLADSPLPAPTLQGPGQGLSGAVGLTHLMQFFGSSSQSVLQRKRSQASQPMGGVRRSPFSNTSTWSTRASKSTGEGWGTTVSGSHSPSPHPTPSTCCSALQRLPACTACTAAHHGRDLTRLSHRSTIHLGLRRNWLFLQLLALAVQ